jgi:hypothetical protein
MDASEKRKALAKMLWDSLPTSQVEDRTGEPPEPILPRENGWAGMTPERKAAYGQWVEGEAASHRSKPTSELQAEAGYSDIPGGKKVTIVKTRKK